MVSSCVWQARAEERPLTGPETEKRFPPLVVPDGFQVTLFACDPLVEYPSVIALGPEPGTLFVAHDYVTGLGVEIVRRDEVRLLRDSDRDAYADQSTLYADGFNSIQGLSFHSGNVYVMHAPLLTRLADTDGDGVADERRDLLDGLGLPPEENSNRLHCANGVVVGHDGWLYLALGDRGCDVRRVEGDRLLFQAGGILRCRPDGRDLHVFSRGLRNIYDVALDEELTVFVRDNENDGGDYMIRVCHCFHGSDHGYPYLYRERPAEAMPPLADLARGSSAGGACYLETAFPPAFRGRLLFCEWGRAVVSYGRQRAGGSFAPMHEEDFAAGAADDPYGFKPTDVVVDRDGSLLISDWADGQRPQRGRGRIYRITYPGSEQDSDPHQPVARESDLAELLRQLDSESYYTRAAAQEAIERHGAEGLASLKRALAANDIGPLGRLHAVWVIAHIDGANAVDELFALAETDADARVRAQAVRAIADLCDPVLTQHRLDAGRGKEDVCRRLASLFEDADPRVRLEVLIALGRLQWNDAPHWLRDAWKGGDAALAHAAMVLLRRAQNWPAVLTLLDEQVVLDSTPAAQSSRGASERLARTVIADAGLAMPNLRTLALRALANQSSPTVAVGLMQRLDTEAEPQRRRESLDLLARIHRRPAEWTYWGFRPAPRPANSVDWELTDEIGAALADALHDPDTGVRAFAVRRMLREAVPIPLASLSVWLKQETSDEAVAAILDALLARPASETRELFEHIIRKASYSDDNRLAALAGFVTDLDDTSQQRLLDLGATLEEGPVLAAVLQEIGKRAAGEAATSLLIRRLDARDDDVRSAAIESLVSHPVPALVPHVETHLKDDDVRVRRAAAVLAGKLNVTDAADLLLAFAADADLSLRRAGLQSLTDLREPRALPLALAALDYPECQPAALAYLAQQGDPTHRDAVAAAAARSRSVDILAAAIGTLTAWQDRCEPRSADWTALEQTIARIQATSGLPTRWRMAGPIAAETASALVEELTASSPSEYEWLRSEDWSQALVDRADEGVRLFSASAESQVGPALPAEPGAQLTVNRHSFPPSRPAEPALRHWLAVTDLLTDEAENVEFLIEAAGGLTLWVNGRELFRRENVEGRTPNSDRFEATLTAGSNRLVVLIEGTHDDARLQLRFRRKSSQADHERLIQQALQTAGGVERGREVFHNAEKSLCLKCHRLGEEGSRIGPDLTGIGSRFSRIHLIESILEPSRTVAPSYETHVVLLANGRVVTGAKIAETDDALTLGDAEGKLHEIPKSAIEQTQTQSKSVMPDGLEKRLTDREFIDLIGFLASQKKIQ